MVRSGRKNKLRRGCLQIHSKRAFSGGVLSQYPVDRIRRLRHSFGKEYCGQIAYRLHIRAGNKFHAGIHGVRRILSCGYPAFSRSCQHKQQGTVIFLYILVRRCVSGAYRQCLSPEGKQRLSQYFCRQVQGILQRDDPERVFRYFCSGFCRRLRNGILDRR